MARVPKVAHVMILSGTRCSLLPAPHGPSSALATAAPLPAPSSAAWQPLPPPGPTPLPRDVTWAQHWERAGEQPLRGAVCGQGAGPTGLLARALGEEQGKRGGRCGMPHLKGCQPLLWTIQWDSIMCTLTVVTSSSERDCIS